MNHRTLSERLLGSYSSYHNTIRKGGGTITVSNTGNNRGLLGELTLFDVESWLPLPLASVVDMFDCEPYTTS
jgi:hypothetical protein